MIVKAKAWHTHKTFGKVKIIGQISSGIASVHQVYKDGVPMLFFERGDRNLPCGFSRLDLVEFAELLKNKAEKQTA